MDSNSFQKILVIIVSRIGDTLLTTPAIKSISGHYKDTEITVLAHPKRYTVLQQACHANKKKKQGTNLLLLQISLLL